VSRPFRFDPRPGVTVICESESSAFLLPGPGISGKLPGMLYGYFDESSEGHNGSRVCAFCGILGRASDFETLDRRWQSILDDPKYPYRVRRFHAVSCVSGNDEFAGWNYSSRLMIWAELMDALIESGLMAVGVALLMEDVTRLSDEVRRGLGNIKHLMFDHAIQTCVVEGMRNWPSQRWA
jgi:hypothetical protein